jgi:hypothetical protein
MIMVQARLPQQITAPSQSATGTLVASATVGERMLLMTLPTRDTATLRAMASAISLLRNHSSRITDAPTAMFSPPSP